jgi:hypothetical protein
MASTTWTLDADDKALQAALKAGAEAYKAASEAAKKAAAESTKAAEEASAKQIAISKELTAIKTKLEKEGTEVVKKEYQEKLAEAKRAATEVQRLETKALTDRKKAADTEIAAQRKIAAASKETKREQSGLVGELSEEITGMSARAFGVAAAVTAVVGAVVGDIRTVTAEANKNLDDMIKRAEGLQKATGARGGGLSVALQGAVGQIAGSSASLMTREETGATLASLSQQEAFTPAQVIAEAQQLSRLGGLVDTAAVAEDIKALGEVRGLNERAGELTDIALAFAGLIGQSGKLSQFNAQINQLGQAGATAEETLTILGAALQTDQSGRSATILAEGIAKAGPEGIARLRREGIGALPSIVEGEDQRIAAQTILANLPNTEGFLQGARDRDITAIRLNQNLQTPEQLAIRRGRVLQRQEGERIAANEADALRIRQNAQNARAGIREGVPAIPGARFAAESVVNLQEQAQLFDNQQGTGLRFATGLPSVLLNAMISSLDANTKATSENTARAGFQPLQSITPPAIPFQ